MPAIFFICPVTAPEVPSGIETDEHSLELDGRAGNHAVMSALRKTPQLENARRPLLEARPGFAVTGPLPLMLR